MSTLDRDQVRAILAPCREALAGMHDATYTLDRQEVVQGRELARERLRIRWRAPGDLHLEWVGDVHRGRKVLYRPEHDGGRMRVKPGRLLPTVKLDPLSPLARRESRNPVWMASLAAIQRTILEQDAWLDANPGLPVRFEDLGRREVGGAPARGYRAVLPKDEYPAIYAHRAEVWFAEGTHVLAAVRVWDREAGQVRVVEDHTFSAVRLNTGLGAADFEPGRVGL